MWRLGFLEQRARFLHLNTAQGGGGSTTGSTELHPFKGFVSQRFKYDTSNYREPVEGESFYTRDCIQDSLQCSGRVVQGLKAVLWNTREQECKEWLLLLSTDLSVLFSCLTYWLFSPVYLHPDPWGPRSCFFFFLDVCCSNTSDSNEWFLIRLQQSSMMSWAANI